MNGIRGDGVNPGLLGMDRVASEDAVRLAMRRIEEASGLDWLSTQILASISGLPGLWKTLEKLPRHQWPTFSRGDCGYGNEKTMLEHEERGLPYFPF